MNGKKLLGILAAACVAVAWSGVSYAHGHDCAGKAGCADEAKSGGCNMKAEDCAKEMKKDAATRGWLGIGLDMSDDEHMAINKVWPDSPAEKAGFQVGDKIVSLNGVECSEDNMEKVHGMLKDAKIGDKVTYVVARGSQNMTLEATLAKIPDAVLAERIDEHMKMDHKMVKN